MYFTGWLSYNFIKSSKLTGLIRDELNPGIIDPQSKFATFEKLSAGFQTGFTQKVAKNSHLVILGGYQAINNSFQTGIQFIHFINIKQ